MRGNFERLRGVFSISDDNPDLAIAQIDRFSRQIPLMYTMVVVNTLALAYDFMDQAPAWLSIYIPIFLMQTLLLLLLLH